MAAGSIVLELLMRTGSFETDTKRAEKRLKSLAQEARASASAFRASFAGNLLSDFTQQVVSSLARLPGQVLGSVDAFNDLRDATGASIEGISAIDRVARETGVGFETVETALVKLNQALNSAKPDSDAAKALRAIGLSADELKSIDPAEALRKVAVALSGFADDGNKARLIQELLGKSAKELAPLLVDLAQKGTLVATTTAEQAQEAEKFRKTLFAMEANIIDVARALSLPLVSSLNETIEKFRAGAAEGKSFYRTLFDEQLKILGLSSQETDENRAARIQNLTKLLAEQNLTVERRVRLEKQLANLQALSARSAPRAFRISDNYGDAYKPPLKGTGEPTKPAGISEAMRYLETLQKQAEQVNQLTTLEQALLDVRKGRLGGLTPALQGQIIEQAKFIDQIKYEVEQRRSLEDAIQGVLQAQLRSADVAIAEAKSLGDFNDALEMEIGFIGKNAEARYVLEQARLSSAVSAAKDKLATVEVTDALGAETQAIRDQIAQLERRQGLLSNSKMAEDFAVQMQEMEHSSRQLRDTVEDTIGQSLEAAMGGNFKSIEGLWVGMINRMVAQALAADLSDALFGKKDGGGSGGGGGLFGSLIGAGLQFFSGGNLGGINGGAILPNILRGGAATGTNFVERDMITLLHKGEAVIPKEFNPVTMGLPIPQQRIQPAAGQGDRPLSITVNVPASTDRATADQIAAKTGQAVQRALARNG